MKVTTRNGVFVMAASGHGATYGYEWVTPLPAMADLVPGIHQTFKADMTVEHATRSFFESDVEVLRPDVVKVGACSYPVLVVHRSDRLNGQPNGSATYWLSPTLMFSVRVETRAGGKTKVDLVDAME